MLILLVIILVGAISIGAFIGNFFYNIAINPSISKDIVYADHQNEDVYEDESWLTKESNYSDEYIKSYDNLNLHAYIIKQEESTDKWAIVVHGYGGKGEQMSAKAKYFYEMGYNVLVPDLRGHGKSEGKYIGMGWDDRLDIIEWINKIVDDNPSSKIVLHGTSMGASTVLMVSGEKLPSNVKAIVSDCAYTSAWDVFSYELKNYLNIDSFPVINLSSMVTKIRAGYSLKEASALEQVKKSTVPILYIHGDSDKFVPYNMMKQLYNATTSPKEMLTVEGAKHANSDLVSPYLYWLTIEDFLEMYVQ